MFNNNCRDAILKRLFNAVARRDPKIMRQRIEWETSDPPRALLEYAAAGDLGKVQSLLKAGVDPNAEVMVDVTVDTVMDTPLLTAAGAGHIAVAAALLRAGAQVDKHDDDDYTPLIRAAVEDKPEMVKFLHEQGAQIDARENIFDHTALQKASRLGRTDTVKMLIALGADQSLRDRSGLTAEQMICDQYGGDTERKKELSATIQKIFDEDRARKNEIEAARRAAAEKYARDLANAAVLENDLTVQRAPQEIRRRTPRGNQP